MNSQRMGSWHRAVWAGLTLLGLAWVSLKSAAAADPLYALVQGSTYTAGGRAPVVPLRGAFRLVPQISPLDWQNFLITAVRLEVGSGGEGGGRQIWRGTGRYSFGGRGSGTQQLVLDLTDGTTAVRYDSGSVPVDGQWPDLDLILKGTTPAGTTIHLMAVPELSRQHFRTVAGTTFLDDCADCDHLPFYVPVSGSFDLVRTGGNPLFDRYHLFNVRFTDGAEPAAIELTGEGTLEIGGEVAIQQKWSLQLWVRTPTDTRLVTLLNSDARPGRAWPMLKAELAEDGGTTLSRFYLAIAAAPFQEIWFTTAHGLTPGLQPPPAGHISNADILSESGRIVVPAAALLPAPGLPASVGVDAFDVIPGSNGALAFSTDQDFLRPVPGRISEGDLLGSDGAIRRRNPALLGPLGFMPPTPDLGLDGVSQRPNGEYWFSIRRPAFSERLGVSVGRGDLLSSRGTVVRSQASLLARFRPPLPKHDYGLDGFHVWSSGEVWFSLEEGFEDQTLGHLSDGDLLSDAGYVVLRHRDLIGRFQPLEDLANFGLRGLFIVANDDPRMGSATLTLVRNLPAELTVNWEGPGRVFQLEATGRLEDPFIPASPIAPATSWRIGPTPPGETPRYFRVRSW